MVSRPNLFRREIMTKLSALAVDFPRMGLRVEILNPKTDRIWEYGAVYYRAVDWAEMLFNYAAAGAKNATELKERVESEARIVGLQLGPWQNI
jgi:hypothetical protein